jgi:hypothetical protein
MFLTKIKTKYALAVSDGEYPEHVTKDEKAAKLAAINDLRQSIHNLKNRFPIGIKSIDDAHDDKLKKLQAVLKDIEADLFKAARVASRYVAASGTYDFTKYSGDFEAQIKVEDFIPASPGSWDDPAHGHEASILCQKITFDTKGFGGDVEALFKKISHGDTLKVNIYGHADHEGKQLEYSFDKIKVTGVKWNGSKVSISCDESYESVGRPPSQRRY